jgi:hypothetical protein
MSNCLIIVAQTAFYCRYHPLNPLSFVLFLEALRADCVSVAENFFESELFNCLIFE